MIRRRSSLSVRVLGACGVAAVAVLIFGDVVGSALTPHYSLRSDAISELVERGAPFKFLVDPLFLLYHSLILPFAYGIWLAIYAKRPNSFGPLLLAAAGFSGVLLTLFFPCDPGCEPFVSLRGTLHIFIAIPMGISILIAIWKIGGAMRHSEEWSRYARYSLVSALFGFVLAGLTVFLAESDFVGVMERSLTFSYLQWFLVVGTRIALGSDG